MERHAEAERLYQTGLSTQAVADMLGVSRSAVGNWVRAAGVPRRSKGEVHRGKPKSAEQRAKMSESARRRWARQPMTDELRARISEGRRKAGRTSSPYDYRWTPDLGYEAEHRRIAAEHARRPLAPDEVIHHIDHDPSNNDPSNLLICTQAEHSAIHVHHRQRDERGRFI